jgi:hypothetical protein
MNTRILKKINERVRIVHLDNNYRVQALYPKVGWQTIHETISLKKALLKKHFQTLIILKDLGYRPEFLKRISKRKWIIKK